MRRLSVKTGKRPRPTPEKSDDKPSARYADLMDRFSVFVGNGYSVFFFAGITVSALEVVMRYGFDAPSDWSAEVAMTLCASAWVLSVGFVTQRQRHIAITMVEMLVGPAVWRLFRLFQMVIAVGAIGVLTVALWAPAQRAVSHAEHSGSAMNSVEPAYLKALLVVGCVLYLLQLQANIVRWVQLAEMEVGGGH